ncbi:Fic family protein [Iodobacter sp. LRB]|uniref:Fic family protein n=1 Tax=unclassified Iodobacter TaxID=235634 RepID=UPI000C0DBED0|nr:Fic family protein [Iodobacter sp. BJB302]PHU99602.1 cell filamentation protein Fic [Iodobacter sp. BJB302]
MAKPRVERAPKFDLVNVDFPMLQKYLPLYDLTDSKGRYLHWDKLKWRVPRAEAQNIWFAIKFQRFIQMKEVDLFDVNGESFSYCIPNSMEAKLHQVIKTAGGSVAVVAGMAATMQIQAKFLVSSLIMEEAISSAQLEGAATTREVAKKMLEDERAPLNEDERMILNNFFLLKKAEKSCNEELSVDLILDFHQVATQGTTGNSVVPGQFRGGDDIYVEDGDGGIAHQPPPHELIQDRLQALCAFANTNHSGLDGCEFIAPVVKAIILHFMLGYEHPFRDGNGRTARALFYWYMLKSEYDLFKYISISKLLKDSPKDYGLSYLYTETDQNDLTYFIDYQLDIIIRAFDELKKYLEEKTQEFNQVVALLEKSKFGQSLNFVQKDIIKKATKSPGRYFSVKEIVSDYGIADNSARSYLNKLAEYRLLLPSKDGRSTLYIAPSDLLQRLV